MADLFDIKEFADAARNQEGWDFTDRAIRLGVMLLNDRHISPVDEIKIRQVLFELEEISKIQARIENYIDEWERG